MSPRRPSRRRVIATAGAAAIATAMKADESPTKSGAEPFGYCLNTSTIRGQNLPLAEEIDLAAKVGYGAIEPWISEIEKHVKGGGTTADLRKHLADHGLKVPSAIGFAEWIVDDDDRRAKGVEQMKRDMDLVAQIGGTRIAAPAAGVHPAPEPVPQLPQIADRYRAILQIGLQLGVTPEVELWGPSRVLSRLGEVAYVATEAGIDGACILLDIYHLHKGGSDFRGVRLLSPDALGVLHTNDYPDLPREGLNDSFRVYPGDGVAPLGDIFRLLRDIGYRGFLSVELFNKDYWKQSPLKVAKAALDKTRAAVQKALT